ncbi:MAG: NAD(P)/FAD-dependent oxidoreductase, partial [Bacteroidaceae bacterium]
YAARVLKEKDYCATLLVNWVNEMNSDAILTYLNTIVALNPQKQVSNIRPYDLSSRLWTLLLHRAEIPENRRGNELGKKGVNRLMNVLSNDLYAVNGKGVFRDEFVTCGGVSLESVQVLTLESKVCPNLYFAGEVLDIDAITGGFNFQAAWTTAYLAAQAIARSSSFFKE